MTDDDFDKRYHAVELASLTNTDPDEPVAMQTDVLENGAVWITVITKRGAVWDYDPSRHAWLELPPVPNTLQTRITPTRVHHRRDSG